MPRSLTWRQLVPGMTIIGTVVAAAAAVLVFARVGSLHGDKYRLYVLADEARGVIEGTEVWLVGQKVGVVDGVEFRPVTADTLGRLAVALDILTRYQSAIRGDSRAEFRNGSTPIGATIVSISTGSADSPMLEANDTLPRAPQIDPDSVRAALSSAASQIPDLLDDAERLIAGFRRALGPTRGDSVATLSTIAARADRLARHLESGTGTLPLLASDTAMQQRVRRIVSNAGALLRAADSGSTLSHLVNDSALGRKLADVHREIGVIRTQLEEERGTAGRLAHDHALLRQLRLLETRLSALAGDDGATIGASPPGSDP